MATVELLDVRKTYKDVEAVKRLNLRIEEGEFFSLLGPSGCGKTTTLRMIAGFVQPSEGRILIGGQDFTALPPERRSIGIVFQNYAIFPHMNVFNNIAYGLKVRKLPQAEIAERVQSVLATVGLRGYENRYQRELSGGEQQRVALARVLVIEPRILLLDEPLSALDKKLREEMKYWIKNLQEKLGITTVYVTHDQNEALTMSDRIAVMNKGRSSRSARRRRSTSCRSPASSPTSSGSRTSSRGRWRRSATGSIELSFQSHACMRPVHRDVQVGQRVHFVVRPENVRLGNGASSGRENVLPGTLLSQSYQGALDPLRGRRRRQTMVSEVQNTPGMQLPAPATPVHVGWPVESTAIIAD